MYRSFMVLHQSHTTCVYVRTCVRVCADYANATHDCAMTPSSAHLIMPNADDVVGSVGASDVHLKSSHADTLVAVVEEARENVKQGSLGQDQSLGEGPEKGRGGGGVKGRWRGERPGEKEES